MLEPDSLRMSVFLVGAQGTPHASAENAHFRWIAEDCAGGTLGAGVTGFTLPKLRQLGLI